MANAGRVEMNLLAVGEDQLSAMLLKVNANVDATKAKMQAVASATDGSANATMSFTDRLKGGIAPLDAFRTKINNVRENAMFLVAGFGAVAGAVGSLIAALGSDAFDAWLEQSRKMEESLTKTRDLLFEVDVLLGKQRARTDFEKAGEAIIKQSEDAQRRLEIALAAERESLQMLEVSRRAQFVTGQSLLGQQQELSRIQDDIRMIEAERLSLGNAFTEVLRKQRVELVGIASGNLAMAGVDALKRNLGPGKPEPEPKPPRPSRPKPGVDTTPRILSTDEDVMAILEGRMPMAVERVAAEMDYAGRAALNLGEALREGIVDGWKDMRSEVEQTTSVMLDFLGTIDRAAQAAFPDLGAGLQEVSALTAAYAERVEALNQGVKNGTVTATEAQTKATADLTTTLIGGGTAIAASVAKTLGGLRAEYIVRSAGEFAAGVATSFTNPAESARHFSASVLYGIAAAKAGGGGGGGGGRGGGGGGGGPSTGSGTVREREGGGTSVINISTLVTDRAAVRRVVGSVMARRDRTGYSGRGGA